MIHAHLLIAFRGVVAVAVGIADLFDHDVVSGAYGIEKPDERIFLRALAGSGYLPEETVHVGNRPFHDVEPELRAGIRPILLDRNVRYSRDSRFHTIASLHDLVSTLAGAKAMIAPSAGLVTESWMFSNGTF